MTIEVFVHHTQWIFLLYFVGINVGYLAQNIIATIGIRKYLQTANRFQAEGVFSSLDIPISVIVPAYNEATSIITSIKALLQMDYPDFELIVVNDGSSDSTLQTMIEAFGLRVFPEPTESVLKARKSGASTDRYATKTCALLTRSMGAVKRTPSTPVLMLPAIRWSV